MLGIVDFISNVVGLLFVASDVTEAVIGREYNSGNSFSDTEKNKFSERMKLAEAGDALSQFKIGKYYLNGDGVAQDDVQAFNWFQKAAEQGYTDAQSTLGRMYFMGEGTQRNNEESYFWYKLAVNGGKPEKWAHSIAKRLKPDQISAVDKRVAEWKPKKSRSKKKVM
jgi:TPR repeat protein